MKKLFSLVICLLLVLAFSSSAFAWAPRVDGKPGQFDPGAIHGYFI